METWEPSQHSRVDTGKFLSYEKKGHELGQTSLLFILLVDYLFGPDSIQCMSECNSVSLRMEPVRSFESSVVSHYLIHYQSRDHHLWQMSSIYCKDNVVSLQYLSCVLFDPPLYGARSSEVYVEAMVRRGA